MRHLQNNSADTSKKTKPKVTMAKAFKTIIWPRRKLVFIGLILIVLSRLSSLVLPWKSKELLDVVIPNNDYEQLKSLLLIVGIAILIQAITSFLLTRILSVEAQFLISELRAQVQKKVLSLPISFFDNTKSGALVSRIMSDVEGVRNLIGTGLVQMVGGTITAVIALVLLINISPSMTLFVLVPVVILE
jgi:subfamily B ATP-binding cassette protein MsbA